MIRTKVRILESLTKLANAPLTAEQIKESLRRFEDFLEILDDNRPNRGGSEIWHFTLKLWHQRSNRAANLRQFEPEWEHRRPQNSKQVTGQNKGAADEKRNLDWWQLCRESLEAQQYERLTINLLTVTNGITFGLELYVTLGLVERKRQDKRANYSSPKKTLSPHVSRIFRSPGHFRLGILLRPIPQFPDLQPLLAGGDLVLAGQNRYS